jgi:hypothetical protein
MAIHWGVHSSHQRWLHNFFWICQGAMFTCCYVLDFKKWTSIPKSRIDECHMHHISSLLVEPSCWRNFMNHLVSLKVNLFFKKVIGLAFDWVKILALLMEANLILEHFSSNHYAKQPCNCFGITNTMQPCHTVVV